MSITNSIWDWFVIVDRMVSSFNGLDKIDMITLFKTCWIKKYFMFGIHYYKV